MMLSRLFQRSSISSQRSLAAAATQAQQPTCIPNIQPRCCRSYVSRAHPTKLPEFPITDALADVLADIEARRVKRKKSIEKAEKRSLRENKPPRTPPRKHPNETIELALNLNLDPRKPGQALRGSLTLPHGTGRKGANVVVFTKDPAAIKASLELGAVAAGGMDVIDQIVAGDIPVDTIQASLATPDLMTDLKKAARILGPRGLMPNKKVGTLCEDADDLTQQLEKQVAGKELQYRTEKEGIVHLVVGKESFGPKKILENIGAAMVELFEAKPESYGKNKKKSSKVKKGQAVKKTQTKYVIKASVCSTQGKGVKVDVRTVDPTSPFFLSDVDPLKAKAAKNAAVPPPAAPSPTTEPAATVAASV